MGNNDNGNRDFFGGGSKKSLQMVTAAMKLKDACSLEGKLDLGSIPGSGRSSGEGNGNPLQYLCPENAMDRGARYATVHGVAKSWTRLSNLFHTAY